jgi:hypothetical protein
VRNFILSITIIFLSSPLLFASEFISGRVQKYDYKKNLIYLIPAPCFKNKDKVVTIELPDTGKKNDYEKGDFLRISGSYLNNKKFKAEFVMKRDENDPTGVRSRLRKHMGGKQRRHRMGHD